MDKIFYLTLLFDFYADLLTEKQKEIFELYFLNDLSLSEIASQYNISRQAVQNLLKRTENILKDYEEKLLLVDKYKRKNQKINEINEILNQIYEFSSNSIKKDINNIKSQLKSLLD